MVQLVVLFVDHIQVATELTDYIKTDRGNRIANINGKKGVFNKCTKTRESLSRSSPHLFMIDECSRICEQRNKIILYIN